MGLGGQCSSAWVGGWECFQEEAAAEVRFERRVRVHQGSRVGLREQRIFPAKGAAWAMVLRQENKGWEMLKILNLQKTTGGVSCTGWRWTKASRKSIVALQEAAIQVPPGLTPPVHTDNPSFCQPLLHLGAFWSHDSFCLCTEWTEVLRC